MITLQSREVEQTTINPFRYQQGCSNTVLYEKCEEGHSVNTYANTYVFLCKMVHVCMLSHFSPVQIFCNPTDQSLPGSSVYGTFPARILEWVAVSYSGDLSDSGLHVRNNELLEHSTTYLTRSKGNTSIFSSL